MAIALFKKVFAHFFQKVHFYTKSDRFPLSKSTSYPLVPKNGLHKDLHNPCSDIIAGAAAGRFRHNFFCGFLYAAAENCGI